MKAILEFTLPEEEADFRCAVNASHWRRVVVNLDQWLRDQAKYGTHPPERHAVYVELRIMLREDAGAEGLRVDDDA